jgi:mannosyltransferase OCH1-like enzyme
MNIIQTWKTKDVPAYYQGMVNKIKTMNPDCNYMFFDDDRIIEFIKTCMPEYFETFTNLPGKIQQIDFFRYLAVYYYGGVYVDLDFEAVWSFKDFIDVKTSCIFPVELKNPEDEILKKQNSCLIGNYAFYSPKGHPFLKTIIDNIVKQRISNQLIESAQQTCTDDKRDVYVYYRTGPILVTQSYIDYSQTNNDVNDVLLVEPTPYQDNCFGRYGYHLCYGSWRHVISDQTPM